MFENPDYVGYVQKQKVLPRAKWHDVKALCRRVTGVELDKIFVNEFDWSGCAGWLVNFKSDVDLSELDRCVSGVVVVGSRAVFIEVKYGKVRT